MITLGSLFDGIGGWPLAATKFGIDPVWGSEIEPFPQKVTKIRFPEMEHLGDITKINGAKIRPVDIITFGSPCQDLSVAGKRKGLDGERSGLFRTAIDIIRRMREKTNGEYPRFIVWENVPGAFSSNKGADFRTVLEEITETKIPMPASSRWATAGMVRSDSCEIAWRTLDAQYWGVPQRRKRIFLVADFRRQCAGEVLFKPESVSRYSAQSRGEGKGIAGNVADSIRTASGGIDMYNQSFLPEIAQALRAANGGDSTPTVLVPVTFSVGNLVRGADAEPNNNGVCKTLRADMGDQHPCICLNDQCGQSIRAAGFKCGQGKGGPGWQEEIAPTLSAMDSGNKPAVAIWYMSHADEVMRPVKDGIVTTLNARMGTGGNQVPVVQEPVYSMGHDERSASFTPNKTDPLTAPDYKQPVIVNTRYKVRRLTPTECERLQGLPDGYTLIDDKKCSDSARYKALGNGMAQPCPDFIMEGIANIFMRDNLGRSQ